METYTDHGVSDTKARRPALDTMMEDCTATQIRCRGRLGVRPSGEVNQAPAASARRTERIRHPVPQPARSHRHRGSASLGDHRVVSASLIVERVRAGMRRAKLEGRQIGRARLDINREQVVEDRRSGMSLTVVAKRHAISRASVCRLTKEFNGNSRAEEVLRSGRHTVVQVSL